MAKFSIRLEDFFLYAADVGCIIFEVFQVEFSSSIILVEFYSSGQYLDFSRMDFD